MQRARDMKSKVLVTPKWVFRELWLLTAWLGTFQVCPECKFCHRRLEVARKRSEKTFWQPQEISFNGGSKKVCQLQNMLIKLANIEHLLGTFRRRWTSSKSTWHECLDKTANNSWMGTEAVYWVVGLTFYVRSSAMNGIFGLWKEVIKVAMKKRSLKGKIKILGRILMKNQKPLKSIFMRRSAELK